MTAAPTLDLVPADEQTALLVRHAADRVSVAEGDGDEYLVLVHRGRLAKIAGTITDERLRRNKTPRWQYRRVPASLAGRYDYGEE
jgi:hypothetical protein